MDQSINNVFTRFVFQKPGSLQFWKYITVRNKRGLKVAHRHQFFVSTPHELEVLEQHRKRSLEYGFVSFGPFTRLDEEWFAGQAAQKGMADQRTNHDLNQILGQLVLPVYYYDGALAGVIELATVYPNESYAAEFNQIQYLLQDENLETKPMAKMIKVTYGENTHKFQLPLSKLSSGIAYIWEQMKARKIEVNKKAFRLEYDDRKGNSKSISSDYDLQACVANSRSTTIRLLLRRVA